MANTLFDILLRDDWIAGSDLHDICRALHQDAAVAATLVAHKYAFEVYDRESRPCLLYYAQGVYALVDWSLSGQGWAVILHDTVVAYDQCLQCGEDLSQCWGPITYGPLPWDPEYRDAVCEICGAAGRGQMDHVAHRWRRVPLLATSAASQPNNDRPSCLSITALTAPTAR